MSPRPYMPPRPYTIHRASKLYKACEASCQPPHSKGPEAQRITDHLVVLVLWWAQSYGYYHPTIQFKLQQSAVYQFLLQSTDSIIPPFLYFPIHLIKKHLLILQDERKLNLNHAKWLNRNRPEHPSPKQAPNSSLEFYDPEAPCNPICSYCSLPCRSQCWVCTAFRCHHPSAVCKWTERPPTRAFNPGFYFPEPVQIDFSPEDLAKMKAEDPQTTKKFNGEDRSQSTYTQPTQDSDRIDMVTGRKIKSKKPTREQIEKRFNPEYADALLAYQQAKREWLQTRPKFRQTRLFEPIGTVRKLLPFELDYFIFMRNHYSGLPTLRKKTHYFTNPPKTWLDRYSNFTPPLSTFYEDIDLLSDFVESSCKKAERNNWMKVLAPFPVGSLQRFLWALFFLKSTNGVADKVSCGHFVKVVANHPPLTLAIHRDPELVASIIRQTSKWVKNTVSDNSYPRAN
jgi:hypothetical protein